MRARPAVVVALLLSAGALSHASAATESPPACTPSGTALAIAAREKQFDKDCLAAPAGQAFTISFDNQDPAVPHNVSIYDTGIVGEKVLFKGDVIVGPSTTTYSVPAQTAGTYEFRCDPHDETMLGTFVVS